MTDLLDRSITASLAHMVARCPAGRPDARPPGRRADLGPPSASLARRRRRGRRAHRGRRHRRGRGTPRLRLDARHIIAGCTIEPAPVGIFPFGGRTGRSSGLADAGRHGDAYLAAITDPGRFPERLHRHAQVPPRPRDGERADHVVVGSATDLGDHRRRPRSVQHLRDDPAVWQVTSAAVVGGEHQRPPSRRWLVDSDRSPPPPGARPRCTPTTSRQATLLDSITVNRASLRPARTRRPSASASTWVQRPSRVRYWKPCSRGSYQYANFADHVVRSHTTATARHPGGRRTSPRRLRRPHRHRPFRPSPRPMIPRRSRFSMTCR